MARMSNCAPATARKAIDELIASGFLKVEQTGRNRGNVAGRERTVSLTQFDSETAAGDPNLPIKLWQENMKLKRLKSTA